MLSIGSSWDYILIFPCLNFVSLCTFLFKECWDMVDMSVSLPSTILLEIQQLVHGLLSRHPVTVHQVMSFLGKTNFVPMGMHSG